MKKNKDCKKNMNKNSANCNNVEKANNTSATQE